MDNLFTDTTVLGNRHASSQSTALDLRTAGLLAAFCMVWGGAIVAIKVSLSGVPPLSAAGIRFTLASLTLLGLERARGRGLGLHARVRGPVLLLGLLLVVQHALFNLGLRLTTAGRASVFLYTQPVFVALLAHLWTTADRLNRPKLAGTALGLVGLAVAFAERFQAPDARMLLGDALTLASAICWAIQTIYQKDLLASIEPARLIFHQMAIASPIFFVLNRLFEPALVVSLDAAILFALFYQGVITAGLTFAAFAALLKRHQASLVSSFIFLAPIFGVLFGHLILGEPLTTYLGLGLGLVALGIFIVNRPRTRSSLLAQASSRSTGATRVALRTALGAALRPVGASFGRRTLPPVQPAGHEEEEHQGGVGVLPGREEDQIVEAADQERHPGHDGVPEARPEIDHQEVDAGPRREADRAPVLDREEEVDQDGRDPHQDQERIDLREAEGPRPSVQDGAQRSLDLLEDVGRDDPGDGDAGTEPHDDRERDPAQPA